MTQLLYIILRGNIISRLKSAGYGGQFINGVMKSLRLEPIPHERKKVDKEPPVPEEPRPIIDSQTSFEAEVFDVK